ncbi:MAG: laccase domain-containing protein, partial [Burkholderiales bacterium]
MNPVCLVPDWPAPAQVRALITTRAGGASVGPYASLNLADHVGDDPAAVRANRARLRALLPTEPVWLEQVHGTDVLRVETGGARRADAAVSRAPGTVCAVLTADCLPVLLADRAGTVVAAAHAGWRGLSAGVLERT